MNTLSRTITGITGILLGLFLIILGIVELPVTLIYGIAILIIAFFILFNKKEDDIEEIKSKGGKK